MLTSHNSCKDSPFVLSNFIKRCNQPVRKNFLQSGRQTEVFTDFIYLLDYDYYVTASSKNSQGEKICWVNHESDKTFLL